MNYGDTYRDKTDGEVLMFVADETHVGGLWLMLLGGSRTRVGDEDHPIVRTDTPDDTPEDWERLS